MTGAGKQYNYCLDFIKGVACAFVVFMHCEFPGRLGVVVQAVSRFCVPFFFMVSGYFCFRPQGVPRTDIKRKIGHVARITLFACVFYLVWVLIRQVLLHNQHFTITWAKAAIWAVFNQPFVVAGQYWFLFALLYAYVLYGILEHLHLRRFSYLLAGVMIVVYIVLAQGLHIAGLKVPNYYYRNWLVEAFPFFMLGHWIHENQERIRLSNGFLVCSIFVFTLLCLVERYLLGRDFGVNICTFPQVFALFVYGVKNPLRHQGIVQRIGRDCSMLVYILHPAVWHSLDDFYAHIGWSASLPARYARPLLVLAFSILLALLFNLVKNRVAARSQIA